MQEKETEPVLPQAQSRQAQIGAMSWRVESNHISHPITSRLHSRDFASALNTIQMKFDCINMSMC